MEDSCRLIKNDDEEHFRVQSPNYPQEYNNSIDCATSIKLSKEFCTLKLKLIDFILEDSLYCSQDFLLIENSEDTEPQRICGQHSGEDMVLRNTGNSFNFQFKTDSSGTTRGFYIKANLIKCS